MTLQERQLDLIRRLMQLEPPLFLLGVYAEDAVLYGSVSRAHADVDVLVWRAELRARLAQLAELGFERLETRFEPRPSQPLVLGANVDELDLEIIILDGDVGSACFVVPGHDGTQRAWMPADMLQHPTQQLDGIDVRVTSPLALHQMRAVSAELFGGFRPSDEVAQAALESKFFSGISAEDLAPRVTA